MKINKDIWNRYLHGQTSASENELIDAWFDYYTKENNTKNKQEEVDEVVSKLDAKILQQLEEPKVRRFNTWYLTAAASILLLVGFFTIYKLDKQDTPVNQDILPPTGANAVIVLEDNSEVELSKIKEGDTLKANGYLISKNTAGEIIYITDQAGNAPIYNTIRTKGAGTANVVLADGSHIWINSKSEIRYPIAFAADQREVRMEGEAYFEIEKDSKRPFYVRSNGQTIAVLGTKFNVNAKTKRTVTSLLEGRVAIGEFSTELGEKQQMKFPIQLQPGQGFNGNAVYNFDNPEQIVDWKDGYFDFSSMSLEEACAKLSEWYDVSFTIEEGLKKRRLFGRISRQKSIKQVLNLIGQVLKINYTIEENRIYIDTIQP